MKGVGCRTTHASYNVHKALIQAALVVLPPVASAQIETESSSGTTWWWLAGVAILVFVVLVWRRVRSASAGSSSRYGAGAGHSQFDPLTPKSYSPLNVGNDASARPWEQVPQSQAGTVENPRKDPEGFDRAGFLAACKADFLKLQEAWDAGEVESLRSKLSPTMLERIQQQLADRAAQSSNRSKTEVFNLQAQLVQLSPSPSGSWVASVEFAGLSRDEAAAGPGPFREIWQFSSQSSEGERDWLVDDVQAIR